MSGCRVPVAVTSTVRLPRAAGSVVKTVWLAGCDSQVQPPKAAPAIRRPARTIVPTRRLPRRLLPPASSASAVSIDGTVSGCGRLTSWSIANPYGARCPDTAKIMSPTADCKLNFRHVSGGGETTAMNERRYLVYDVFTEHAFAGNPLAVVLDSDGLDTAAMQQIAREFNLSETVFVLAPPGGQRTPIRIFTPPHELPFAGHPTVGTAVALTELTQPEGQSDASILVLEEAIGPLRCLVSRQEKGLFAEFTLPRLPERADFDVSREAAAAALGLDAHEVGFENHVVSAWSAGVPYICIPVRDLSAAGRAMLDTRLWVELVGANVDDKNPAAFIYCRETVGHESAFHARMFAGHLGIPEDPATGSAVAALAGAIVHFDQPVDGTTECWIEQGVEMGRPSYIRLELDVDGGVLSAGRIGGYAVKVAEGKLLR